MVFKQQNTIFFILIVIMGFSFLEVKAIDEIEIGNGAIALQQSLAVGINAKAYGPDAVAVGSEARAERLYSTALGVGSSATAIGATALGAFSHAYGTNSMALGGGEAKADHSFTLGANAITENGANGAVAIGSRVSAEAKNAFVLGSGYFLQGGNFEHKFINNKANSMAVGFNSDKATLFVGGSNGQGTTGNVGVGTDTPEAKLDVAGDLKATNISTGIVNAESGVNTSTLEAKTAKLDYVKASKIYSENIDSSTERTDLLQVKQFANINSLLSQKADIKQANIESLSARLAKIEALSAQSIAASSATIEGSLTAQKIQAGEAHINKAVISEMSAKEANIQNAKIRDIKIYHSETNESFNEKLFVGTRKDSKAESTAIVAYEKVDMGDAKETPEMTDLKSKIQDNEKRAEVYYSYAKRYARYSWASRYKTRGDLYALKAQNLKMELLHLPEQQVAGTKKVARVGVGVNDPQQTLHIAGAMRLEPLASAPMNANTGDMYVDKSGALCIYLNGYWNQVIGKGYCSDLSYFQ